jgi:hypothetical protein
MQYCNSKNSVPSFKNSVSAFFESFNERGMTADFSDRRGTQNKLVVLSYQGSGLNLYAANKLVTFDNDSQLSNSTIKAIECLGTAQMAQIPTTDQLKDIPQSQFAYGMLVLKNDCDEVICKTPLANLCRSLNGNKLMFFDVSGVSWAASGVVFKSGAAISAANALGFKVHF